MYLERSESIKELCDALCAFQGDMENVTRDSQNPFYKSRYSSFENIISTTKPHLKKHGLSFAQFPVGENELVTILMHKSGEFLQGTAKMTPKDNSPQAQGSAITYLRRYALSAALGIASEDDDGNEASGKRVKQNGATINVPLDEGEEVGDIQITGTDTDEVPVMSEADQKKAIIALVKKLEPETDMKSKKAIEGVVTEITQLALVPKNYAEIILSLTNEVGFRTI